MGKCYSCFCDYNEQFGVCPSCGRPTIRGPKEPIYLYPGTVLAGRYIVGEAIKSGGFGIIYKAWDSKLKAVVAIKELFINRLVTRAEGCKEIIVSKKSAEEFSYRKERFISEAKNMAKFGSEKTIPNVFEVFEENNTAYIVMELLKGYNLDEYIDQLPSKYQGRISMAFSLEIITQIASALKALHEKGIIHRDVSPDNIFVCEGQTIRLKLLDLGAAKLQDSTDDVIDIILKPGYSPPEQYDKGNNIGPWTDIYALGATLYYMLTGVKPEESTNRKIQDNVVAPMLLNPEIPESLNNVILKAMAVERQYRFQTIDDFLEAIKGNIRVLPPDNEKFWRRVKRFCGIGAACLALAIAIIAFAFLFADKDGYLQPTSITIGVPKNTFNTDSLKFLKESFYSSKKNKPADIKIEEYDLAEYNELLQEDSITLFLSSGLEDSFLKSHAIDLKPLFESVQTSCPVLQKDGIDPHPNHFRIPAGFLIPAAIVRPGQESAQIGEDDSIGTLLHNAELISVDQEYESFLVKTFGINQKYGFKSDFDNKNSSVYLTMRQWLYGYRMELITGEMHCIFPESEIRGLFTCEWSISKAAEKNTAERKAAERFLGFLLEKDNNMALLAALIDGDGVLPVNGEAYKEVEESNPTLAGVDSRRFTINYQ